MTKTLTWASRSILGTQPQGSVVSNFEFRLLEFICYLVLVICNFANLRLK